MGEMNSVLKQEPRPEKQATVSIISGVTGWVCLGILILLVNAKLGVEVMAFAPLIVICIVLVIALPFNAITRGVRAIQTGAALKPGKKAQAWAGIYLGGLLYLGALGYLWLVFRLAQ